MAGAAYDSNVEFAPAPALAPPGRTPPSGPMELAPDAPLPEFSPTGELPVLDLNSDGPLPFDLPDLAAAGPTSFASLAPAQPTAPVPDSSGGESFQGGPTAASPSPSGLWFQGDVLMCACPDCGAPMSIRVWLMVADCWKCTCSIELDEQQEREAMEMIRQRDAHRARQQTAARSGQPAKSASAKAKQPAAVAAGSAGNGSAPPAPPPLSNGNGAAAHTKSPGRVPTEKRQTGPPPPDRRQQPGQRESTKQRQRPANRKRQGRRSAAAKPVGVRARVRKVAAVGVVRVWVSDFFRNMPAWIISMVFHMVLLTLLALLMIDEEVPQPQILLVDEVHTEEKDGGDLNAQFTSEPDFDRPNPDETEEQRRARVAAEQDARDLRIDPDDPNPALAHVEQIRALVQSDNATSRTFAARDPRLRAEIIEKEGGTTETEAAVSRALRYLAGQQRADGGWQCIGRGSDSAGTSLALLPFLGAGQTHQVGIYKENVAHGLRWLIENQSEDGDLRGRLKTDHAGMYAHGQGAIVLCEAFALTGDEQLRQPAQRAIDFIVKAQNDGGGWRYQPGEKGDTSVVGWQLMALQSARVSGLDVPDHTLELADQFLDTVSSEGGSRYSYVRGQNATEPMTAEGLLCRVYLGWTKRNPALEGGLDWLMEDQRIPHRNRQNLYYWYYGTQLAHHIGGPQWDRWNVRMRSLLVNSQEKRGEHAGSWAPKHNHGRRGGRIYATSLAACSLEVYYRHAPIFRQIELEED